MQPIDEKRQRLLCVVLLKTAELRRVLGEHPSQLQRHETPVRSIPELLDEVSIKKGQSTLHSKRVGSVKIIILIVESFLGQKPNPYCLQREGM